MDWFQDLPDWLVAVGAVGHRGGLAAERRDQGRGAGRDPGQPQAVHGCGVAAHGAARAHLRSHRVPVLRQPPGGSGAAREAAAGQRPAPDAARGAARLRAARRSAVPRLGGDPQPLAGRASADPGQHRAADRGLPGLDRGDGAGGPCSARVRPRRVLHLRVGRHDVGPLFDAMADAAARGVAVRFCSTTWGRRGCRPTRTWCVASTRPTSSGTRCCRSKLLRGEFRRPDLRNHRKLHRRRREVGFMGSQNLTEPGLQQAEEPQARPRVGRADGAGWRARWCTALEAVFAGDWYAETDEVLDVELRGPRRRRSRSTGVARPARAERPGLRHREQPADVHDPALLGAAADLAHQPLLRPGRVAALRRHDRGPTRASAVELFVSEQSDQFMVGHAQASYYRALLEAGVGDLPLPAAVHPALEALHDRRRRRGHRLEQHGHAVASRSTTSSRCSCSSVRRWWRGCARSRTPTACARGELTLEEWGERSPRPRYVDNVMRLTAALQ